MYEQLKKIAGEKAAEYVKDGMVVGLGTGSTVKYTILKIGEMIRNGLDIIGIPTSKRTEELMKSLRIKQGSLNEYPNIDLTIDGADEVDANLNLIKGGGGALLREKIVAYYSTYLVIVVDESKMKTCLGSFPLPVEVVPYAHRRTAMTLKTLGCEPRLRMIEDNIYVTDNGNYIVDCQFKRIEDPENIEKKIDAIPGVVESGLFVKMAKEVIVGTKKGVKIMKKI